MRKLSGLLVLAVAVATGSAYAQSTCSATPYSVRLKEVAGKITVSVPAKFVQVNNPAEVSLGAGFNRGMFSALAPVVVDEILDSYGCVLTEAIDLDQKLTDAHKQDLKSAWSEVRATVQNSTVTYFSLWAESNAAGIKASPLSDKKNLAEDEQALAKYIAKLPKDNFTIYTGFSLNAQAVINGITTDACGVFVRSALVDNESNIQHLANALRPVLVTYVSDVKNGSRDAKMKLWTQASTMQMPTQSSKNTVLALQACEKSKGSADAAPATGAAASVPATASALAFKASDVLAFKPSQQ
ncbi:hypothetical protein J2W32_005358 [Variovorax boronicumulans]|uniref:Uncharacterized protein n=1 Tax=Variovorax boronicumulans TaxID=436515 RepID=A0AAW8D770_9BURK|nr:hypothetical protein [Variovorax boronicumulans]MDP9896399.1 hypothetical protein [Variovorax boronicumulans]MDQ0056290.1 hypothetical protein [Variovorax boronicumulans]